jgi:hypothetical protein
MNPAINKTGFASFVNKYEIGEIRFDLTMAGNSPTRTEEAPLGQPVFSGSPLGRSPMKIGKFVK